VVAEGVGTALLLAAIVGSGIMGERLAGGNVAIALLANSIATGAALASLILAFGPMARKITYEQLHLIALAALALMLGASFIAASPARADHDDGPNVGFHFSFGFPPPPPPPPVAIYGPPPVYYYSPAPRVVIQSRPYYRDWYYRERHYPSHEWRHHRHRGRSHHHHD
jgi:hypothetical protein